MRLSSLKLSGFKSFADSTTLHFKANRSAVVGPNGCGKSNIIDAIRWVMGESSARQLRGGSMQDVIFTGTAKRKPVGVASVELRFDNTAGTLGGTYQAYNELAIRRQVNREGKSEYFLNGSKCRRRDITDLFLGTGLGPRSYAIIEQGMINRLIDAKPDDMRVFIEEAAGISRYQARRRETLLHLEHTQQNLARLDDILAELKAQRKSLKRQSEAAIQYKNLKTQIRRLNVEMLSFQYEQSMQAQQQHSGQMTQLEHSLKVVHAELGTVEQALTASQEVFQQLIQQSSPLQQAWQQAEQKLSELKRDYEQKQARYTHNCLSLTQLQQQQLHSQQQLQQMDADRLSLLAQQQQQLQQQAQQQQQLQQYSQNLSTQKPQQQQLQQQFAAIKTQVERQQQQKNQCAMHSEQLAKNILRLEQQKTTLQQQMAHIHQQHPPQQVQQLNDRQHQLAQQIEQLQQGIQADTASLDLVQAEYAQQHSDVADLKSEIHILQIEQNHLRQLLIKNNPHTQQDAQQLMQLLKLKDIAKPHAALIEKFLAQWLSAHVLDAEDSFAENIARQLKPQTNNACIQLANLPCLADWIIAPQHSIWQQVAVTEHLAQALSLQATLRAGQSILTLDGYHVAADWVIGLFYDSASQAAQGTLTHQIRLDEIDAALGDACLKLKTAEQQLLPLKQQIQTLQQTLQQQQAQLQKQHNTVQHTALELASLNSAQHAFSVQKQQLTEQLQQLEAQLQEDLMQKDDLDIDLHALDIKLAQNVPNYQQLQSQVTETHQQLEKMQEQAQQVQQQLALLQHQHVQTQQQIALLEKDEGILKSQLKHAIDQIRDIQHTIASLQSELPAQASAVDQQAQLSLQCQNTCNSWQVELNQIQQKQQQLTEQRHQQQQQHETLRTELEHSRLAVQAAKSDAQHYAEQLSALNTVFVSGLQIDLTLHQQQLSTAQQQFTQLGAVNLAAMQEYEQISLRFEELDHQMQDLQKTVDQLQAAMKSIDQETRKLFMATFNQINLELQDLFPKVFNGGEASLTLDGDWQSGVKLMARPPGKRNSALALLSGGEKALTALALVFAIFRLNPAPFCVLDEVDAPLDDANVARFCNLVKELSEQVQFIYITHNKVAMTMATDLLGVTMPEPGTSKLVTVDLEHAKEYGLVAES